MMKISNIYAGTVYTNSVWSKPGLGASMRDKQKFARLSKAELKALKALRKNKR